MLKEAKLVSVGYNVQVNIPIPEALPYFQVARNLRNKSYVINKSLNTRRIFVC